MKRGISLFIVIERIQSFTDLNRFPLTTAFLHVQSSYVNFLARTIFAYNYRNVITV